eukprot:7802432-Pyramimonas_sp.AAC.1
MAGLWGYETPRLGRLRPPLHINTQFEIKVKRDISSAWQQMPLARSLVELQPSPARSAATRGWSPGAL